MPQEAPPTFQSKAVAEFAAGLYPHKNPPPAAPPANPNPPPPAPKVEPPAPTPPPAPVVPPPQQQTPPPAAPDGDAMLDDILDGKETVVTPPAAPTPPAEPPKDSVGMRNLRAQYEATKAELEKLRDGNKPLTEEINALKAKLAAYDIQEDPGFQQKYDAPLAQTRQKLLAAARSAGLDMGKAEALLSQPLTAAAQALADIPAPVQNLLLGIHTEHAQHLHARQEALATAPTLAGQLAEQRKAQAQAQQQEAIRLRNAVLRETLKGAAKANPLLRPDPANAEHTKAIQQAVMLTKQAVEGGEGQAPSDVAAAQIELMYRGAMFDHVAAQLAAANARADRILAAAKARGLLLEEPSGSTPPPAAPAPGAKEDFLAARAAGKFRAGGDYDVEGRGGRR